MVQLLARTATLLSFVLAALALVDKRPVCCSVAKKNVDFLDARDLGVGFCQLELDGAAFGQQLNVTHSFTLFAFLKYTYDEATRTASIKGVKDRKRCLLGATATAYSKLSACLHGQASVSE